MGSPRQHLLRDLGTRLLREGDPDRLVVAGDSAGANLAAVTAIRARDEGVALAAQLLAYPTVDPAGDYPSRAENADGYFLTARDMAWFSEQYLGVPVGSVGGGVGAVASAAIFSSTSRTAPPSVVIRRT